MAQTAVEEACHAASQGNIQTLQTLIVKYPLVINLHSRVGWSPLCSAINYGQTSAVRFLLQSGADPNLRVQSYYGGTPVYRLMKRTDTDENARLEILKLLIEGGADLGEPISQVEQIKPLDYARSCSLHLFEQALSTQKLV